MYLEQESKFDSTKDASDFGGGGLGSSTTHVKDYASSVPDSMRAAKAGGAGSGGAQDRSYDEVWQVD